jgi:DNA modification methylase
VGTMSAHPVMAVARWASNADLIASVARLGYLKKTDRICDPTYGSGVFWKVWQPDNLVASDIRVKRSPCGESIDFRKMPYDDGSFDVVALDGPYKLNGSASSDSDARYGVHVPASWQDRMQLIRDGITECARVLRPDGVLLLKCMDQVCSGHVRWQTIDFANHAAEHECVLVDQLHPVGGRPQPERSRKDGKPSVQHHARRNISTLQVYRKAKDR